MKSAHLLLPIIALSVLAMSSAQDQVAQLVGAHKEIAALLHATNSAPIMVRLGWHDAGTFDKDVTAPWPKAGGAQATIRFMPENGHGANAGLSKAIALLEPIKAQFPLVSYADLFQMASATAIEVCGGPRIAMKYGRLDGAEPDAHQGGNLPDAEAGPDGHFGGTGGTVPTKDKTPEGHLRKVFHRMGLTDQDIVALSGAHTIGRAHKDRSGLGADTTKHTDGTTVVRADGKPGQGATPGGSAWTENWQTFDNSYFKIIPDPAADAQLLKLSTDKVLFADAGFKPFAEKYRDSQEAFFADYAASHKKLSELGTKFEPAEGIIIDDAACSANLKAAVVA